MIFLALIIATIASIFGNVFQWLGLTYIIDAFIHIYILGFGIGRIFHLDILTVSVILSVIFTLGISIFLDKNPSSINLTNILLISNFFMALGLVFLFYKHIDFHELEEVFMPFISTQNFSNIYYWFLALIGISIILAKTKNTLIRNSLAFSPLLESGLNFKITRGIWIFLACVFVCFGIQKLGFFTINSLIFLPPAIARLVSKNPLQSLFVAGLTACGTVVIYFIFLNRFLPETLYQPVLVVMLFVLYFITRLKFNLHTAY